MAETFDTHGSQTFENFGNQYWIDDPISPWSNDDVAIIGFPHVSGPMAWPYGIWSVGDSFVMIGLYPLYSSPVVGQIGGISQVFRQRLSQIGGAGEVYVG